MRILSGALLFSCCVWAAVAHNKDGKDASEAGKSKLILEDPIQFATKAKDRCSMALTRNGDLTKLRISCLGLQASYACEYEGKPDICRNYNANPRHYFTQIMWELRKLNNACKGPGSLKPTMCKKASDESQMIMISGSSSTVLRAPTKPQATETTAAKQDHPKPKQAKPEAPTSPPHSDQDKPEQKTNVARQKTAKEKPLKPQPTRPSPARPAKAKVEPEKPAASKPGLKTTTLKKVSEPKTATQAPATTTPVPKRSSEDLAQQYCWHGMQDLCAKVIGWFTK